MTFLIPCVYRHTIQEIRLFITVSLDAWGVKTYWYNDQWSTKRIQNISESELHYHQLKIHVSQYTTNDQLKQLKSRYIFSSKLL